MSIEFSSRSPVTNVQPISTRITHNTLIEVIFSLNRRYSKISTKTGAVLKRIAARDRGTVSELADKAKEISAFQEVLPLKLFVDDVTAEKLASVLAENRSKAAIVSAEGGIFDILSGIYTKNVNIDVFLKGHSGDTIRVDRIGRASESIVHPTLTMLLAVQPGVNV